MNRIANAGTGRMPARSSRSTEPECALKTNGRQLIDKMPGLYDNATLSDVTFVVGQRRELHAHRVVLAAVSDRFFNMFNSKHDARWHEKVLPMDDFDPDGFDLMLRYIYGQRIVFQGIESASILLEVATHFEVRELINAVQAYLVAQVNVTTCCILWNCAHRLQNEVLEERCMDEMAMRLEEVAQCPGFLEVDEEALSQVMQREDLQCTEEKVFEALLHWVNHRLSEREASIDNLLPLVRLSIIDPVYLQDSVDNNRLLRNSKKAAKLLMEAYKYQASPAHRKLVLGGKLSSSTKHRKPPVRQHTSLQHGQHQPAIVGSGGVHQSMEYRPMQQVHQQTPQITRGGGWGQSRQPQPATSHAAGTPQPSTAPRAPTGAPPMQQVYQQPPMPSSVRPGPGLGPHGTPAHDPYRSAIASPIPETQPPPFSTSAAAPSPSIRDGPGATSYFGPTRGEQPSASYYGSGFSAGVGSGGGRAGHADASAIVGPYVTTGGDGDWR